MKVELTPAELWVILCKHFTLEYRDELEFKINSNNFILEIKQCVGEIPAYHPKDLIVNLIQASKV